MQQTPQGGRPRLRGVGAIARLAHRIDHHPGGTVPMKLAPYSEPRAKHGTHRPNQPSQCQEIRDDFHWPENGRSGRPPSGSRH